MKRSIHSLVGPSFDPKHLPDEIYFGDLEGVGRGIFFFIAEKTTKFGIHFFVMQSLYLSFGKSNCMTKVTFALETNN